MVTIRDLSARCGLSISAVSKALNGYADISEKTRERVRRAAAEMGYVPNAVARTLKTNRSRSVGVLLEDDERRGLLHHFFVPVLESFRAVMEKRGFDLMLMNHAEGDGSISYLERCRHRNLDGVFIACMNFEAPELIRIARADIPLVTIDHPYEGRSAVFSDNFNGIGMAVRHAAKAGHVRIAYVSGAPSDVTEKRVLGFRAAMAEMGLPVPEGYLRQSRYRDIALTRDVTAELLGLGDPPTCILMPDDYAALGGLKAISAAGLSVPGDLSVIGYDGMDVLRHWGPRLTTIQQDTDALGRRAAELLLEQVESAGQRASGRTVTVPVSLLEGQTVAPPGEASPVPCSAAPRAVLARG